MNELDLRQCVFVVIVFFSLGAGEVARVEGDRTGLEDEWEL